MIDCREAVRRMWIYLDNSLGDRPLEEFEAHLETCQRCCGELEFNKHLRDRVADADTAASMSLELRSRVELLLADSDAGLKGRA
jgi:anti-sigma factor (TIGR02949 family)